MQRTQMAGRAAGIADVRSFGKESLCHDPAADSAPLTGSLLIPKATNIHFHQRPHRFPPATLYVFGSRAGWKRTPGYYLSSKSPAPNRSGSSSVLKAILPGDRSTFRAALENIPRSIVTGDTPIRWPASGCEQTPDREFQHP